jgi:ornithine carbamoyltransferase
VAFSLAEIMLKFGHDIRIASPEKYSFDQIKQSHLIGLANAHGGEIIFTTDPREAVRDTNFIYADTFISM